VKLNDESYSEQNYVRKVSNEAFREGMVTIFEILCAWGDAG
jgi:hypothetical protein